MSKYDGLYVKLAGDPTFWAVDDGKRHKVADSLELYKIGLRPVRVITLDEFHNLKIADHAPKVQEAGDEEE